jgi:hypothetical protein
LGSVDEIRNLRWVGRFGRTCAEQTDWFCEGRATVTVNCEAKREDHGLAAIRFVLPG